MAENKKKVIVYTDWIDIFKNLTDEEAGKLIKHFFMYVNDLNPETDNRIVELMFIPIKATLKRDLKTWEERQRANSSNGKLGGRPRKPKETQNNQTVNLETQHNPKKGVSVSVSDSVKVNDNVNNEVNSVGQKTKRFSPPTIQEVKNYCLDRKNNVNSERFIDHYTSNGWMVGKNKMKDWKAAVRTWEKSNLNSSTNNNGKSKQQILNDDLQEWVDSYKVQSNKASHDGTDSSETGFEDFEIAG